MRILRISRNFITFTPSEENLVRAAALRGCSDAEIALLIVTADKAMRSKSVSAMYGVRLVRAQGPPVHVPKTAGVGVGPAAAPPKLGGGAAPPPTRPRDVGHGHGHGRAEADGYYDYVDGEPVLPIGMEKTTSGTPYPQRAHGGWDGGLPA